MDAIAAVADELVAEIEGQVPEAGAVPIRVRDGNGIAELPLHPAEGPLLGERVAPGAAAIGPGEGVDVLNDAGLLVVRLFDQEAVVGDGIRGVGLLGGESTAAEGGGQRHPARCGQASHPRKVPNRSQALRPTMTTTTTHAAAASSGEFTNCPIFRRWPVK